MQFCSSSLASVRLTLSLLRHPAFPKVNEETFRPFTNLVLGQYYTTGDHYRRVSYIIIGCVVCAGCKLVVLLVTITEESAILLLVVLCVQGVSW